MKARSRPAPARPAVSRPLPPTPEAVSPGSAAPWDCWLDHLPAARRQELLPFTPPVLLSGDAGPASTPRPLVQAMLAGRAAGLPVAPPVLLPAHQLSAAAARALQTPDICLWNRGPGQDLSAPCVEVVRQAVRQGLRVLVLAAAPTPLERMLTKLAADPTFLAVRFSAPGEHALNGPLTRFDLDEQRLALRGRLLARAAQARADLDVRRARARGEAQIWESLTAVVREIAALDGRGLEMSRRIEQLAEEVRREAEALTEDSGATATGPFAADFAIVAKGHHDRIEAAERALLPLRDQRGWVESALAEVVGEQGRLAPRLASYRAGKWWTFSYWKARLHPHLRQLALIASEQARSLEADRDRLRAAVAAAEAECQAARDARDVEVRTRVEAEVKRRRTEIEQQLDILRARRDDHAAQWRQIRDQLTRPEDRPAEPTHDALADAHNRWLAYTTADGPLDGVEANPQDIVAGFLQRMPSVAPVVVGTTLALARNAEFAAAAQSPFDLVVLDDADRLAESELVAIFARGRRALAIGSGTSAPCPFAKLWRLLHRPETATAYQWSRLNGGLICTLRPLTTADEPHVESERLADFPEIELRILSAPKHPPRLAQVVFPASLSAVEAKTFIYRELEEAAVDRVDRPKKFLDSPELFRIAWECPETSAEENVDLEPGLREAICVVDGQLTTCRIEFDKTAGWDQAKIDDWLRRHIPTLDAPRTADLTR